MAKKYILAIDHGTSGVKTSIISTQGEIIDFEYEKTSIYFLPKGGAEQDPAEWWQAVLKTSKCLVQKGKVPVDDIVAVCVSSMLSSTVAVDREGNHLMNSLSWMDSRAAKYVKKVLGGFPSIEGYNVFKLLKWIPKTGGGPSLSGKDDIAHVLITKHEFPDIYEKTYMFLPCKDYINLKLTGKFAAGFDSIHMFWITDIREINNIHYDEELIRILDIDRSKLPPLKAATDVLGTLSEAVADEIGLKPDIKVVMGAPDHEAACIGSGAVRDFEGHIYIGTSSWVQAVIPFKKTDVLHSIASFPTAIPGKYQSANEQDVAGGCLNFLFDNLLFFKNQLTKYDPPDDPFAAINEIAKEVPAGSNKLIFTPWLNGERTPVDDHLLRAGLYNISKTTTQNDILRAFMEGVAYNMRWSLKYVEKFVGRKLNPLRIIGGGAKSEIWCQIFSDVLDREIRQVKDPMQANARGAAFIASVALGYIGFGDIPDLVQYENTYHPNPANRKIYDGLFKEFVSIYKNNKAMYRRLNKI
jgi:xylulokinase